MADIEEKLDILIKAYMEDRQRFQTLPLNPQVSKHSSNNNQLPNIIESSHCVTSNNKNNEWQNRSPVTADTTTSTSLAAVAAAALALHPSTQSPSTSAAALCSQAQGTNIEYTKVYGITS